MKTTLALLTATLLLLTTPALSLAHDGCSHCDVPRNRQEQSWGQPRPHHDFPRDRQPPRHWQRHLNGQRGEYGYWRPPQPYRHLRRDLLLLGLPGLALQLRW